MRIIDKSEKKCYSKYQYNSIEKIFCILDDDNNIVREIIPDVKLDDEYNPKNFEMIILHNEREDCTEESIYQVCVEKQRIGWIFPIQAIRSKEHSYAENKFFLKYAYVAWNLLIEQLCIEIDSLDEFDLFREYPEEISLLVLDKDNCNKVDGFEFNKYIVGLYQKGYSVIGKGNLYGDAIENNTKIHIKRQSKELDDIPYLIELFKKQIPRETNDISRFYLYYQVIEILISKVFDEEFSVFIEELQNTTEKLFDKKEDLGQISNEKWRVRKLCNNYCSVDTYLKKCLNEKCIEMLTYTNCKVYENMEDNLYQVRCLMVHRMYMLDDMAEKLLSEINDIFLEVIIQLVISYKTMV
ncbi:MAG: hypothetical protein IJO70_05430 [Lachnospiraceae bacterium]|nr:hypothetical protein [Lachnospiraceae bacterium]